MTFEEKVRALCAQAVAAGDEEALDILLQLKHVLREHRENLTLKTGEYAPT